MLFARKKVRAINMLEQSLSQLEALVSELLQANQALLSSNAQLTAELAQARDDNDNLQLSALEQDELQNATLARIQALVEKPASADAPSNLAITGRYVLHKNVWKQLVATLPGVGNEIQLTDAIAAYLTAGGAIEAYHIADRTFDCGDKLGLAMAYVEHALRHEGIGEEFAEFLRALKV